MDLTDLPLIAAFSAGLIAFILFFRPFFGKTKDFWECVAYSLKPDFFSWLDRDLDRDFGKSMKLGFFLFLCTMAGVVAYAIADSYLQP